MKDAVIPKTGAAGLLGDDRICKVSIVGIGMRSHVGVASKMFAALSEEGINIQMITTSEIKTSVVHRREVHGARGAGPAQGVRPRPGAGPDLDSVSPRSATLGPVELAATEL